MNDIKVRFNLEIIEDGFPPIGVETLNGVLIGDNIVKLNNTPFFAKSVAVDDILRCIETNKTGVYEYEKLVTPSGNKAISIIFLDDSCKENVYQYLKGHGCYCEYGEFGGFNMLAVAVDKKLEYDELESFLQMNQDSGIISYAELCFWDPSL